MNILTRLQQMPNPTESEQTLIQYILASPNEFIGQNAAQITKKAYVSVSTIYRLCEKLDLNGLAELKVQVAASLPSFTKEDPNFNFGYPFGQGDGEVKIIESLKEDYEQTINHTKNMMDPARLHKAAAAMKKADCVDVYASAGNLFFAKNFQFQLMEIGVNINVPEEEYVQRLQASASGPNHLAIIISYGGRGLLFTRLIDILRKNGTPILMIGAPNENPYMNMSDLVLCLSGKEDHHDKISSFSTRLSLLYVLDALYSAYFSLDYERNSKCKQAYYQQLAGYDRRRK